jgi:hypothetical protein
MNVKSTFIWVMGAALIVLGLLVDGYAPCRVAAQPQTGLLAVRVERIGVMRFLKGRHGSEIGETPDCPLSQLYFNPERLSRDSDRSLTRYVHEALQKRHGEKAASLEKALEAYGKISKDEAKDTLRTLAVKLGESLEANLMVAGTVWRYQERSGSAVGAISPSSVAFVVYLIDVASGKILWKGNFNETQRSLSENVLDTWAFIKKGAKWLSADELARYGVREVFKKFPL